jgi:hypothetical protein
MVNKKRINKNKLEVYNIKNQTNSEKEYYNETQYKNITLDSLGSSIIINESKLKCLNNTNFTICINISENNNETCIPECYLNCQVHFLDELEQKFCLLNVCKCEICKEILKLNNTNNNNINKTDKSIINNNTSLLFNSKVSLGIVKVFIYKNCCLKINNYHNG